MPTCTERRRLRADPGPSTALGEACQVAKISRQVYAKICWEYEKIGFNEIRTAAKAGASS